MWRDENKSLINKSFFALDANGKWLAGTDGTDDDNIMMQLLQCFLHKEAYRKSLPAWLEGGFKVAERVEPIDIEI